MRIAVDFNTILQDEQDRVRINTNFHKHLDGLLQPGLRVTLYDEELEVDAVLEVVDFWGGKAWLGRPDWSTRRDL